MRIFQISEEQAMAFYSWNAASYHDGAVPTIFEEGQRWQVRRVFREGSTIKSFAYSNRGNRCFAEVELFPSNATRAELDTTYRPERSLTIEPSSEFAQASRNPFKPGDIVEFLDPVMEQKHFIVERLGDHAGARLATTVWLGAGFGYVSGLKKVGNVSPYITPPAKKLKRKLRID